MILEKTLKYSHKQKCSARKVSPSPPSPPPSPIITTKQTKPKKMQPQKREVGQVAPLGNGF